MTTFRQLPLSRLGHLVPPLVEGQALIALMPVTADLPWAAKAAWDIARIAAREGRRVALVDLHLEQPGLHEIVGLPTIDGIVDAFEYGVSLTKAAHEVNGVFFIPAGSDTAGAADLYAQPRWRKLQAGFRSEGALLLVFVSPAGLAQLSAVADGAIVLAPEGLDPASAAGADVAAALERGTPLLGVARDRWMPSSHRESPPLLPLSAPIVARPRRGLRAAAVVLVLAGGTVSGWALRAPLLPSGRETAAALPAARLDTLGWTIQLAAYASLDKALAHADRLAAETGVPGLVTPVPQSDGGPVWYRVLAGSYATRADAAEGRAELWRRGAAAEGIGDLLRAPFSYRTPAGASLDSLRVHGLPAVQWSGRIIIGAFETPEQAAFTEAALARAGVRATLLPRMGKP
ncbi:MAG TPA: SPOR domain-containing protein [Gemmatimonadales bacterium]|nr:SPOR domain-containing protein [Gemmatimonadales bacterium]